MSFSETIILIIFALLGIGYGIREYARFIAINRKKSEIFTYSPLLLLKRLFTSMIIVLISVFLALTIVSARKWESATMSTIFLFLVLFFLALLFIMVFLDFKEVLKQYRKDRKKFLKKDLDN